MTSDPIYSETVLDAELHDPHITRVGGDAPEGPGVQVRPGVAPIEMVQEVERLEAKLERLGRRERDCLRQRDIDGPERRSGEAVANVVAEGPRRRLRERRAIQIRRQRFAVHVVARQVDSLLL